MMHLPLLFLMLFTVPQDTIHSPAMTDLVSAERAFASMSVERGIRESFMTFFGEDGISFQPGPVRYKETARKRPPPQNPKAYTLNWWPISGDISASGDLGYTTGPYSLVDNTAAKRPTGYGYYFTVWTKEEGQSWKVALDIGISTNHAAIGETAFRQAAPSGFRKTSAVTGDDPELKQAEQSFGVLSGTKGLMTAYRRYLGDGARLHREGSEPITETASLEQYMAGLVGQVTRWKVLFAATAASNDLGYTYGSYETLKDSQSVERGYFGRVWRRNSEGQWRIVADITNPLPADQK